MAKRTLPPATWLSPLPAVLVSSRRPGEKPNIITVSWCGIVCSQPPMLSISIRPATHSFGIVSATGEFVVNVPSRAILEQVDRCGTQSGKNVDKFAAIGLTPVPASEVGAPLVAECPVNLECVVRHSLQLGLHRMFVAEIVAAHVDEALLDAEGKILPFETFGYRPDRRVYVDAGVELGGYGFTARKS